MRHLSTALLVSSLAGCAPEGAPDDAFPATSPRPLDTKSDAAASWVVDQIESWNKGLDPADRQAKYAKLAADAHAFFRGTNHIYWSDLAGSGLLDPFGDASIRTWILGDLHAENLGSRRDAAGRVVYAMNDFDEAVIGDFQLDLWRLAVSIVLVGRERGLPADEIDAAVDAMVDAYVAALLGHRAGESELSAIFTAATTSGPIAGFLAEVAAKKNRRKLLDKWTVVADGAQVLATGTEKLAVVDADRAAELTSAIGSYQQASAPRVKGVGRRLGQGTGSLGVRRYYLLLEGESDGPDDDLLLDVKQQPGPTALASASDEERSLYQATFANHAARAVEAEHALGAVEDPLLGWIVLDDGAYTVRELDPWGDELDTGDLAGGDDLRALAAGWGEVVAAHHARGDRDHRPDLVAIDVEAAILDEIGDDVASFRDLVRDLAGIYADQVEADHAGFKAWLER